MSKMKQIRKARYLRKKPDNGQKLVFPFLVAMAVLTIVAFIIPLRPTVSESEKRELAKFPKFSMEALISGDYFDDITLWFSDTFPGREGWITLSDYTSSLHGYSEIAVVEDDFLSELLGEHTDDDTDAEASFPEETTVPAETASPEVTAATEATANPENSTVPAVTATPEETTVPEDTVPPETAPEETQWGGVDAGDDAEISMGAVVQIGDTAFNTLGFTDYLSDRYAAALSKLADALVEEGVRVVSAPSPTSVGILIKSEYLKKLGCVPQDEIIQYLHNAMSDNVIKVDTYSALVTHNSEYLYFRTDHHWTARGAYYSYAAIVEALGMEAAPLDSFEEWNQGDFKGTLYSKAPYKTKLKTDTLYAYIPQGDIETNVIYPYSVKASQLLFDKSSGNVSSKYLAFLGSDYEMVEIINHSLPDAGTCLIIKDSFGNCFAPFMTQNYHKTYVMDYRTYRKLSVMEFVKEYEVDDVIIIPYLIATQSKDGAKMFEVICKVPTA